MIPSLAGIEAFVHTAERASFRAAAQHLGVTPAAVSKAVARLEDQLAVRLLDRTSRRVSLTPEGARYLARCRTALDELQAGADEAMAANRVAAGPVRLSLPYVFGRTVVAALGRLTDRHPRLELDLRFTDRPVRLLDEDVDVALRVGALDDSALIARRLRTLRWVVVASPGYLARRGVPRTPVDLARGHVCLKFTNPGGSVTEWAFAARAGGSAKALRLPTHHRLDQGDLLVQAALSGVGVCQAFGFMVEPHLAAGTLLEILAHQSAAGPPVHALCRPHQQHTPRVRAVLDYLAEVLGA